MRRRSKFIVVIILFLLVGFLLIRIEKNISNGEIYPETTQAPILQLTWPEKLDPADATRYTPYGIWENAIEQEEGVAYEPANEMQFYMKTDASDYLAVAPGVVTRNETFKDSVGLISVKYGENYIISYLHIIPDKNLKTGSKVKMGDVLGKMEKAINPHHGEETWWEIQLTVKRGDLYRTLPPYDYFDEESQEMLDRIAENSREISPGEIIKKPYWTVSEGCSWIKYTGVPEWWDSNRFSGFYQKESEKEFIENINPNWKVADNKGNIIGPTDACGY